MTNIVSQNFSPIPRTFLSYIPNCGLVLDPTPQAQVPSETVTLSAQAQEPHLYEGFSNATTSVKVDRWRQGENDGLENILLNQGYSRQEMYTKNAEGLTLVQQVARANNLKDPNVVAEGFELKVPTKLTDAGQPTSDIAADHDCGHSHNESGEANGYDDNYDYDYSANDGNDFHDNSNNSNSSANSGSYAVVNNQGVAVLNQGNSSQGDSLVSYLDLSESSQDGYFENKGRKIAEFFGFATPETVSHSTINGASNVNVQRQADGKTDVTATVDGQDTTIMSLAGDSDDSLLERSGEVADKASKLFHYLFDN